MLRAYFAVVLLIAGIAVLIHMVRRISIPQRRLLLQLEPGKRNISFTVPSGHHFNLVVGVPKDIAASGEIGDLVVKSGTNFIGHFVVDTRQSAKANWLDVENLDGYVITMPVKDSSRRLSEQLKIGTDVTLYMDTFSSGTGGMSLWLTYLADRASRGGIGNEKAVP
jgi:hypothetical protein